MNWASRIGRRIKLSDLHVFLTVAQTGSMARAASDLAVSHPVISRSISQLEHVLGVRLLERTGKGISLTECRRTLQLGAHGAFDELRQTVDDLDRLNDPTRDFIRLGTTPALAASYVSRMLQLLHQRHPRISVKLQVGEAETQRHLLEQREIDVLVHRQFFLSPSDALSFEPLFQSPYVIAAGSNNPLCRKRKMALADLMEEPWLLPPVNTRFGSFIADAFNTKGLPYPVPVIETSALEIRTNLLSVGPFVTAVPRFSILFPHQHPSIKQLDVDFPNTGPPIGLITHRRSKGRPASALLIDVAREVASLLEASTRKQITRRRSES